jgi:hypothetical protein
MIMFTFIQTAKKHDFSLFFHSFRLFWSSQVKSTTSNVFGIVQRVAAQSKIGPVRGYGLAEASPFY